MGIISLTYFSLKCISSSETYSGHGIDDTSVVTRLQCPPIHERLSSICNQQSTIISSNHNRTNTNTNKEKEENISLTFKLNTSSDKNVKTWEILLPKSKWNILLPPNSQNDDSERTRIKLSNSRCKKIYMFENYIKSYNKIYIFT